MKITALMPVRNEDWVLGLSARVALMWCDSLVMLLHCCTDTSAVIAQGLAEEYPGRVRFMLDDRTDWPEMDQRQQLLEAARAVDDPTHIAIVDADEILCGDSLPHIRKWAEALDAGECMNVRMHCPWRALGGYRVDPCVWSNRRDLALVFRDSADMGWQRRGDGYQHHARAPRGSVAVYTSTSRPARFDRVPMGVLHLQWVSWPRLTAKHALYKVRERIHYPEKPVREIETMYNLALDERGLRTAECPDEWLYPYRDLLTPHLNMSAEPWQAAEARRLYATREPEYFAGLDLFGVCR